MRGMEVASHSRIYILVCVLALAALACSTPLVPNTPTPTPVPPADQVTFSQPYISYLHKGDALPGSTVRYEGEGEGGYILTIDDQRSVKKSLDSLNWKGQVAPGVTLDYKLRVIAVVLDQFEASGTVDIVVDGVSPAPGTPPENADIHFDALIINSTAKKGYTIPGTLIGYAGMDKDKGAQITGVDGYAYRQALDSIDWTGQVRPGVWLKANLRVVKFDEKELTVAGTNCELWIDTP